MIQFYGYPNCSTCRTAKKNLDAKGILYEELDITATPPSKNLVTSILACGDYSLKTLFNRSGQLYRQLDMKSKMNTLDETQLIQLLVQNGKLVKRPIVTDGHQHTVGYDPTVFDETWR